MSNRLPAAARELAGLLAATAPLWRPAVFRDDPPWVVDHPGIAAALLALDDAGVDALERDPDRLAAFIASQAPALAGLADAAHACLAPGPLPGPLPVAERHGRDVPGRKWQQTLYFAAAAGAPAGPVVDWCCGKAHLGRLLARAHGARVTGIERQASLCAAGNDLAARDRLDVHIVAADALRVAAADAGLGRDAHAVALHACGDLHLALLRTGAGARVAALDIAPCCYHLTAAARWQPLSATLAASPAAGWQLNRDELHLAVQETATASERVVRQARRLAAWRLGFDVLQRQVRGVDAPLPTPSRPVRVLGDGFPAFCRDMAAHHRLDLPAGIDYAALEQAGEQRHARMRRLQLLRHACRRPLEVLLVADRALWLAEQGYDVRLRAFCPRSLTPRNLLVQARRRPATGPAGDAAPRAPV